MHTNFYANDSDTTDMFDVMLRAANDDVQYVDLASLSDYEPEEVKFKEVTSSLVAHNADNGEWVEKKGREYTVWYYTVPSSTNLSQRVAQCEKAVREFVRDKSVPNDHEQAIRAMIFSGRDLLPSALSRYRGTPISFTAVRPPYYFEFFSMYEWSWMDQKVDVRCDNYAGVEHFSREQFEKCSFLTRDSVIVPLSTGSIPMSPEYLITGAREKLDGDQVCYVQIFTPQGEFITLSLEHTVFISHYDGCGYTEKMDDVEYHISGSVTAPRRNVYTLDNFTSSVAEGLILIVGGCEFKIKWINTFDVESYGRIIYDNSSRPLGAYLDPKGVLRPDGVYEAYREGTKIVISHMRPTRERGERYGQISAISSAPTLSSFLPFLEGTKLFTPHSPLFVAGPIATRMRTYEPQYGPSLMLNRPVPSNNYTSLRISELVSAIRYLTQVRSPTIHEVIASFLAKRFVLSREIVFSFASYCGCVFRSDKLIATKSRFVMSYKEATLRPDDEVVVATCGSRSRPLIRSSLAYGPLTDHHRPTTVALGIRKADGMMFLTSPAGTDYKDFAAGGMTSWGETPDEALCREVREEMAIYCEIQEKKLSLGGLSLSPFPLTITIHDDAEMWSIFHYYEIVVPDHVIFRNLGESRQGEWQNPLLTPMRHDYALVAARHYSG